MTDQCSQCGAEVERMIPREPCPICGSTAVAASMSGTATMSLIASGWLTAIYRWTRLLETADSLFVAKEYGVAVVVAASACEVIVERAMSKAFQTKKVSELDDAVTDLLVSYSLNGERNRKLYNVLTGDDLGVNPGSTTTFWEGYKTLVQHRNKSAHSGVDIPEPDARKDIDNAKLFVAHVEKHNRLA